VALVARRADRLEGLGGEIAASRRWRRSPARSRSWAGSTSSSTTPGEEWEQMVQVNLLGLLYTAHAALPHLLEAAEREPRRVADLVNISSVAGRMARKGSGVYNATKHGVGAFSEALRQEVAGRHLRVSLVEPGAVATELQSHNRPEVRDRIEKRFLDMDILQAEDIADAISYVVARPRHVAVNEILVRPTQQEL
jgi:NADP-dependent 3-hydroxy acid dehydrogenase YdfG